VPANPELSVSGRTFTGAVVRRGSPVTRARKEPYVIVLGIILLIIGFIASIPILWTIGIIVVVAGLILALLGSTGRAVGGRRHYF
jgi:protein-S-isoprenylcysteine O-methyltransferase Ste14